MTSRSVQVQWKTRIASESYQLRAPTTKPRMTSPDDYAALRESAAIGAIAPRGQIAVAGPDRATFLHGLLTNDITALTAGSGCYAAWLTPQGRMLCDLLVLESGDMMLLDVPAGEVEQTAARLEQFHFTENVQIATLASLRAVWIHGPQAPGMLESLAPRKGAPYKGREHGEIAECAAWVQYQNARVELAGVSVVIARIAARGSRLRHLRRCAAGR